MAKDDEEKEKETAALDERDIQLLSRYVSVAVLVLVRLVVLTRVPLPLQGVGPYTNAIKALETSIIVEMKNVNELIGEDGSRAR